MRNSIDIGKVFNHIEGRCGKLIMDKWQRPYVWRQKQWNDLFDTILKNDAQTLKYIGNFIYYYQDGPNSIEGDVIVVDGQQRITTITIILAAIRDMIRKKCGNDSNRTANLIDRWLTDRDGNCFISYKNTPETNNVYESIINDNKTNLLRFNDNPFAKAYNFFSTRISNYSCNELESLFASIGKLSVVELLCESYNEAYYTFINQSKGAQLTSNDHIKTKMMNLITNSDIDEEKKNEICDDIQRLFSVIDKSFFCRYHYYVSNTWVKPNRILSEIDNDIITIDDVKKVIEFNKYEESYDFDFKHPSLLVLYDDFSKYKINNEIIKIIHKTFSNAIIRSTIIGCGMIHEEMLVGTMDKIQTIDFNNEHELIDFINKELIDSKRLYKNEIKIVSDEKLQESLITFNLYKAKHNLANIILWKINRYMELSENIKEESSIKNPTIDHIMPQVKSGQYIHTIGNLTILSKEDNSSKGKKSIENSISKINGSSLKINKDLYRDIVDKIQWTDDDIIERTKKLSNIVIKII